MKGKQRQKAIKENWYLAKETEPLHICCLGNCLSDLFQAGTHEARLQEVNFSQLDKMGISKIPTCS